MNIMPSQDLALNHFRNYARNRRNAANELIHHILRMTNVGSDDFEQALSKVKSHARVAVHFHPDRLDLDMKSVAAALLHQGIYKSQFETGLSSGSVSAHPGGARDLWEKDLYGGAYHTGNPSFSERPKYGAFNLMGFTDGPAPSFGSCHFLLKPKVSQRCTFTYLDSHLNPAERGTLDEFDDVIAGVLKDIFLLGFALGKPNFSVAEFVQQLTALGEETENNFHGRFFDRYIETQVHGEISLANDVDQLVADPAFKKTEIGAILQDLCKKYNIKLTWHQGYVLPLDRVPNNFRGSNMPSLAKRVATENHLDVSMIGVAAASLRRNPEKWVDRGSPSEVLQELKLLWHVLAKFGDEAKCNYT